MAAYLFGALESEIYTRFFHELKGVKWIVQGPQKYDFLIGGVAEGRTLPFQTQSGKHPIRIEGVDRLNDDAWSFRGWSNHKRVEGFIHLGAKPDALGELWGGLVFTDT